MVWFFSCLCQIKNNLISRDPNLYAVCGKLGNISFLPEVVTPLYHANSANNYRK